ncbi:MAG: RNA polymerase subunit sigma-24 [Planctomycetota bacterium]
MTHPSPHAPFATTRWSLVQRAAATDPATRRRALGELCEGYWRPVYAWLRRDGHAPDAAADLTQGFVAQLLTSDGVAAQVRGRFRAYLLGALRHFVANERRRTGSRRRGGGTLTVDPEVGERLLADLAARDPAPDAAFDRAYALELLGRTLQQLERECALRGQGDRFALLRPLLDGGDDDSTRYADVAQALDLPVGTVRVATHRLRQRFAELLRREIAETVAGAEDVEAELADLRDALAP